MKCTQSCHLSSFPKVRVLKRWFRHFNDHKEFRNDGTLHLFSLMALYTYSNLLSMLSLCPSHEDSLKARGLSSEEITWLGYRTTPAMRVNKIVAGLWNAAASLRAYPVSTATAKAAAGTWTYVAPESCFRIEMNAAK